MAAALKNARSGLTDDVDAAVLQLSLSLPTSATSPPGSSYSAPLTPASASSPTASVVSTTSRIAILPATGPKSSAIRNPAAAANMASPSASGPLTMTSKEWVIPPRPKPGRKPATDTPPTKRKAQNRAAQRAFRERRAARVGELEEQLEEQKEEHDRLVREMQDRITHLEIETQTLRSHCQSLEALLEKERSARSTSMMSSQVSQTQLQSSQMSASISRHVPIAPRGIPTTTKYFRQPPEPRQMSQSFSISQIISPPDTSDVPLELSCGNCNSNGPCVCADEALQDANMPIGCGGCTLGSRCACLEETIKATMAADLKRPRSPGSSLSTGSDGKRQRSDVGMALETDFTAMFASSSNNDNSSAPAVTLDLPVESHTRPLASIEPKDSCGFCEDGTYCVCADSIVTFSANPPASSGQPVTQQTHTPPPSEDDVVPIPMEVTATGAIKLPGLQSGQRNRPKPPPPKTTSKCGPNGPGTCAQCLSDPKSGLFCRSLAANFERNNRQGQEQSGGCCGNGGPGGCCKAGNSNAAGSKVNSSSSSSSASGLGLSLSCADAYKTLASHRHFDEAADDIGSWLPKLRAVPVPPERPLPGVEHLSGRGHITTGRAPIEVEAASIMSVLKGFDVRFGRGE
ncbi:hypothetical protein OQA88_6682 [Cercophora sp. LCS_1]